MKNSLWIWENSEPKNNEYAEFYTDFNYRGSKTVVDISADSNYALYINGEFIYSGQYPDSPENKIYDSIDITDYVKEGINHFAAVVWYYGKASAIYRVGKAGLKFCIYDQSGVLKNSSVDTLSRLSPMYKSHTNKEIDFQLGFSFEADASFSDNWKRGEVNNFHKSVLSENDSAVSIRPCAAPLIYPPEKAEMVKTYGKNNYIFDFGSEVSGLLGFRFFSDETQTVTVCFGEHLADGKVRRIIDSRDFSFLYTAKKGENEFFSPLRRFGCRYVELRCEKSVEIKELYIRERLYPAEEKNEIEIKNPLKKRIWNICINTLKHCMGDHYEDCPWREQALYVMDSRNQMLCGYYAFKGFEYARSNLLLIAQDDREDGLLSLTFPSGKSGLTIPSFSLHYFTAVAEYLEYSGDTDTVKQIYPKLASILDVFVKRIENGLVPSFEGGSYWNFFEWIKDLDGKDKEKGRIDVALNCLLIIAIEKFNFIAGKIGKEKKYETLPDIIRESINQEFLCKNGFYKNSNHGRYFSELTNALAVLSGTADTRTEEKIQRELKKPLGRLKNSSLSMACYKYDSLLSADSKNIEYILADIDKKYGYMLKQGATTFWETLKGQKDFDKAGSLCHGWSAIPVYYYGVAKKLGIEL